MRMRCLTVGCNPVIDETTADQHREETGHRVAKWPVRSKAGEAKARARNSSGYYDKYNVGAKSAWARGVSRRPHSGRDDEAFSEYAETRDGGIG